MGQVLIRKVINTPGVELASGSVRADLGLS